MLAQLAQFKSLSTWGSDIPNTYAQSAPIASVHANVCWDAQPSHPGLTWVLLSPPPPTYLGSRSPLVRRDSRSARCRGVAKGRGFR
jgi:hypothetical protein